MVFKADLHCHTNFSDGSLGPEEIIEQAVQAGLSAISITDHDSIGAYPQAIKQAKEKGLEIVVGIEMSTVHRNEKVHVLGYGFDLGSLLIKQRCLQQNVIREKRNQAVLKYLEKRGVFISYQELKQKMAHPESSLGRVSIANVMLSKGYATSLQEAFSRYLKSHFLTRLGIEAYVNTEKAIEEIHLAGGRAVLAHPQDIESKLALRELMEMKFDGLEVYHAGLLPSKRDPWIKIAQEKNWIMTGGSDFHGEFTPDRNMGSAWVDQATFEALQSPIEKTT